MPSEFEKIVWLLRNASKSIEDNPEYHTDLDETTGGIWNWLKRTAISMFRTVKNGIMYMIENPRETLSNIWNWVKRNKWKILIVGGILVIAVPLAIGFAPGGIVAGSLAAAWQSSIGAVTAGSAFAVLQSLGMTGMFTGVGAALISMGGLSGLPKLLESLKTSGASCPQGLVHQLTRTAHPGLDQLSPQPTQPAAAPELPFPIETNGTPLWKWLAGGSEPPFELEGTGIDPEEARIMVLGLLACDEELPSLLHNASITEGERNSIWGALEPLRKNGLGGDILE